MQGQGTKIMNDGSVYKGFFKENVFCGRGKLKLPNGQVYKGNFKNGQVHDDNAEILNVEGDYFKGPFYGKMEGKYLVVL